MKNNARRIKLPDKTVVFLTLEKRGMLHKAISFFRPRERRLNEFVLILSARMYLEYEKYYGPFVIKNGACPDLSEWAKVASDAGKNLKRSADFKTPWNCSTKSLSYMVPFNGKSAWASLRPGQKCAAVVGVPIIHLMFRGFMGLCHSFFPWIPVRMIFDFLAFFTLPFVYVNGIGIYIAVVYELLFTRRR